MRPVLSSALSSAVVLFGCSGKDGPVAGGRNEPSPIADGVPTAYWVADRVEPGAEGEGVAVLENPETLRTEDRPMKSLPAGVKEGSLLTDGGTPAIDEGEAAARTARILERFERLKAD